MANLIAVCFTTICVSILTIYSIVTMILKRHRFYKLASKFQGPPCLPIMGNANIFFGSNSEDMMKVYHQLVKCYQSPIRIWMAQSLFVGVMAPERIKVIYLNSKTLDKGDLLKFARPYLGTGLLTASAAKWRVHRKLINPTFYVEIVHSFVEVFAAQAARTAKLMEQKLDDSEFQISGYSSPYALMTICETTMGINLETEMNNDVHRYAEAAESAMHSVVERMLRPWLYPDFIFYRTKLGRDQQKHVKFLNAFTDNVIQKKKKFFLERSSQQGQADNKKTGCDPTPPRKVFLDHLLNLSNDAKRLPDEELRDEVNTIMVAGSDTTATLIDFVMLMLASNPQIQEKVFEELCEIHEDHEDRCNEELVITVENLRRMTYLDRVIKETMRVLPVGPYLLRSVTGDVDFGEYTLPKGSQVFLSIFDLHRNEEYWPDPLKFDPDRFLPKEVAKRHPYSYLPFGAGPRNCIGSKYGMLSVKTFVATILWKYVLKKDHVTPIENIRLKSEIILRTVEPITLRIVRRRQRVARISKSQLVL